MRFFTSDLHFGHRLMTRLRGFGEDVDAHDAHVIRVFNSHVSVGDDVWILGDLTLLKLQKVRHLVEQLNGSLRLVLGNHDTSHPEMRGWEKEYQLATELFDFVGVSATLRAEGTHLMMSHFPYTGDHKDEDRFSQWRLPDHGRFLLHGHTHSTERVQFPHSLHVGWDAWNRPVTESEVMTQFMKFKKGETE